MQDIIGEAHEAFAKTTHRIKTNANCHRREVENVMLAIGLQSHYSMQAKDILDHQLLDGGKQNHTHHNTFYLIMWPN
ncbi:unnamed protein product [Spirodela intermedia]|uniref:Uncharacterized protein n=2 Tax=Spirodela intermedia TaxID=51605 RepID=A0A7I8I8U3_SPIIN|nr:unnamed protein product [Spirodela intermedia]CAA6653482.1 unnamed protein product [Spirodela intermedia]